MRLLFPRQRVRQPNGVPRINWSNPLTKGLVSLVHVGSGNGIDLVSPQIQFTVSGVTRSAAKMGSGFRLAAAGANGVEGPRGQYGKANIQFPLTMIHVGETANTDNAILSGVGNGTNGGFAIGGFSLGRIVRIYTGSAQFVTDSGAWNNARGVFGFTGDGTNVNLWDGGKKIKTQALSGTIQFDNSFGHRQIFGDNQDGGSGATGFCQFDAVWNRVLTDAEMTALALNPQQLLMPDPLVFPLESGAASDVTGTFASTLDSAVLAAAGTITNVGSFSATLAGCTMVASGTVAPHVTGDFASTLGDCVMAAAGTVTNVGAFASTLGGATMAAAGTVAPHVTGEFASTLDGCTMSASGFVGDPVVIEGITLRRRLRPRVFPSPTP